MKIAICYLTNLNKDNTISNYIQSQIKKSILENPNNKNQYDLYNLINTSQNISFKNSYTFTWNELRNKYNYQDRRYYKEHMGICNLPLFYLKEKQPNYDYYIFYEDDLYFTGFSDNVNPFENLNIGNYDIVFSYERINNPNWFWVSQYEYNLPDNWIGYEGLLNSYIISKKALEDLEDFCLDGKWHGHHELMVNSFFYNQKEKYRISHYTTKYKSLIYWQEKELQNTLINQKIEKYSFIHPIKNIQLLRMIK